MQCHKSAERDAALLMEAAAYNLVRMRNLLPTPVHSA
jgi:hypothetical protein